MCFETVPSSLYSLVVHAAGFDKKIFRHNKPREADQKHPHDSIVRVVSARLISTWMTHITGSILDGGPTAWSETLPMDADMVELEKRALEHRKIQKWRASMERWLRENWPRFYDVFIATHTRNFWRVQETPNSEAVNQGRAKKRRKSTALSLQHNLTLPCPSPPRGRAPVAALEKRGAENGASSEDEREDSRGDGGEQIAVRGTHGRHRRSVDDDGEMESADDNEAAREDARGDDEERNDDVADGDDDDVDEGHACIASKTWQDQ